MPLLRKLFSIGITFCLYGCIVVDDFGAYWDKGFIDYCVNEIVKADMAGHSANAKAVTESVAIRSLRLDKHTFLMIREHAEDKGGNMIRYAINDGEYVSYRLNEDRRGDFSKKYPDSLVIVTSETATIPVLNKDSIELLGKISADESYWVESRREPYNPSRRNDCVHMLY